MFLVYNDPTFMKKAKYLGLFSAFVLFGCTPAAPPDTRAADEAAIRKADADWVKAAQTKQADAWVAFYSDDAAVLPPNDKLATTREAIHKSVAALLGLPGLAIGWQPVKVEVARSGDLGYAYGAYQLTFTDPKGKTITDTGKNVEVWRKQSDGGWKCIVDTWNSDLPAAP
jgi:ketosteroid isomerase-like protein